MNSGLHLTLTVGDKGIKCPSPSTPKASAHASPFATAVASSPRLASVSLRLHSHPPRVLEGPQGDAWADELERGHTAQASPGKHLAGVLILPGPEACRSPGPAGAQGAPRHVF